MCRFRIHDLGLKNSDDKYSAENFIIALFFLFFNTFFYKCFRNSNVAQFVNILDSLECLKNVCALYYLTFKFCITKRRGFIKKMIFFLLELLFNFSNNLCSEIRDPPGNVPKLNLPKLFF